MALIYLKKRGSPKKQPIDPKVAAFNKEAVSLLTSLMEISRKHSGATGMSDEIAGLNRRQKEWVYETFEEINGGMGTHLKTKAIDAANAPYLVELLRSRKESILANTMEDFWETTGAEVIDGKVRVPSQMRRWNDPKMILKAIRFGVEMVLSKDPINVTYEDMCRLRLIAQIRKNFNNISEAISAAFPEENISPSDMKHAPYGYYDRRNSATAIREMTLDLIAKGKITHRSEVKMKHIEEYHLRSALRVFGNKIFNAINAAFPEEEPLVSSHVPRGFYNDKGNRIRKLRELATSIGKEGKDITHHDLKNGHISTILHYHNGSLFSALLEAGLVNEADKRYVELRALNRVNYKKQAGRKGNE